MANDLIGTIRIRGAGSRPHHVSLAARARGEDVLLELTAAHDRDPWSGSCTIPRTRWEQIVDSLARARTRHNATVQPPLPDAGDAHVELDALTYAAAGGTSDLAFVTAELVIGLVVECGGPSTLLRPERSLALGSVDDTIDETALNTALHDTIPEASFPFRDD